MANTNSLVEQYEAFMNNPVTVEFFVKLSHGHDLDDIKAFGEAVKVDEAKGYVRRHDGVTEDEFTFDNKYVGVFKDSSFKSRCPQPITSLEASDRSAAEVAQTPWRVSLEMMKGRVKSVEYIRPNIIPHMTICVIILDNGYALQGMSAPADPANFNLEKGQEFAYEDAMRKLWALEAYVMRDYISGYVQIEDPLGRWNPA